MVEKKINCIIVDDEPIARDVLKKHISKISKLKITSLCKNAIDAFKIINEQNIDLIFLDINMPEISGLSFAKSINKNIKIIFTTAYREYAIDGFDLRAVDYLLKPISFDRLLQAIDKYLDENVIVSKPTVQEQETIKNNYIFVRSDRKMVKINFEEILYIESIGDYIKIFLTDKNVITRENISGVEAKLPKNNFIRTHRSYIASVNKIESFTNEYLEIKNKMIPISRSYRADILKSLEHL